MTLKKDKQKVLDEVWTDERIKSFLDLLPPEGINADFHCLYSAYKSMKPEDFEKFAGYFADAGKDFSATDKSGATLEALISDHKNAAPYLAALKQ